ncbi:hypothetical protein OKW30_006047 [Paraburkholderia sp. Clong3]|uniref:hypothetical protein n=1 Tax=Paraburkholderia sp. Clong3 TaxID=2991061 RepID=UPI003D1BDEFB
MTTTGATLTGHGTVIATAGFSNDMGGAITAEQQLNLIGDIDNAGTITVAAGGELRCFGTLEDSGSIALQANSVGSLEAVASGQTITFAGNHAKLVLRNPGAFSGAINGFGLTHSIELEAEATVPNFASGVLTLTVPPGKVVAQLQMQGPFPYTTLNFHVAPGLSSVITFVP